MARFVRSAPHPVEFGSPVWLKPELQLQVLLIVAVLFGGGGSAYGVCNLVVQLLALVILALNPDKVLGFFRHAPRPFVVLSVLTLMFPLAQLVPLPAALWAQLPGRELLSESLSLVGRPQEWHSLSLAPARTLIALFSLIPVLTVFVLSWGLGGSERARTLRVMVVLVVAVALLGGLQMLTANRALIFYPRENIAPTFLYGSFANHNSSGLFFDLGLAFLLSAEGRQQSRRRRGYDLWSQPWLRGAIAVMFAMAVILTGSRSSMGVLLVVAGVGAFGALSRLILPVWTKVAILLAAAALCAAALFGLQAHTRFSAGIERFDNLEDVRPLIWADTVSSAKRYWPVGSGISSFPEVFEVDETLEHVWSKHAGRAHNDYLEIAQEGGFVGLALIAAWLVWVVWTTIRAWLGERRWQGMAAASGVVVIALQSIVDYPLRNQAVLCLGAFLACLLLSAARARAPAQAAVR